MNGITKTANIPRIKAPIILMIAPMMLSKNIMVWFGFWFGFWFY